MAAGGRDIRIGGGADLIQQYLNAGLVNEFTLSIAPVLLGEGIRLFDCIEFGRVGLEVVDTVPSPRVTHLSYAVSRT
jgi:dihydrofolate reductase